MANINDTLDLVTQRTGSTSGSPQNEAEAAGFRTGIKLDIASVMNQMNNVYYPLFSTLSSTDAANALTLGLAGNVLFTHIGATAADASAYWDAGLARTRTIKETVDVLLTQISDLENQISFTVDVAAYDDAALTGLVNNNTLNLKQLRLDAMGENYGFDNDGAKDLTYPLSQAIDAMGAFFTGYPGSGNTYPGTPVYPTLALAVNLSDVVLDTTVPVSTITGLGTFLTNVQTYTGMSSSSDTAPTYSTHGAITTVTDGHQLERAIQALDAGIAASSGAYSTAANITSNTVGDVTADDFVHGSTTLDDAGVVAHDNRMLFDKSAAAFRAGSVTGTMWDLASRGSFSAAFGLDNTASGIASFVGGGTENVAAALSSVIAGGGASGSGNTIGATSSLAFIGCGTNHEIGTVGASTGAFVGGGLTNRIGTTGVSTNSFIGGGSNNTITTATHATVAGGATNTVSGDDSFIGGGSNNSVTSGVANVISGGAANIAGGTTASDYSTMGGGQNNKIDGGSYNVIAGGGSSNILLANTIDTAGRSVISGGADNTIDVTSGFYLTIGGGSGNEIGDGTDTLSYATIAGGADNVITGTSQLSSVGGGSSCTITGATYATIAGGDTNSVTANYGTVVGGGNNVADSTYSTAMGQEASTDNHGVVAHSAGQIAAVGDAQFMRALWRIQTTDATANVEAFLDGSSVRFAIDDDSTYAFFIRGVARRTDVNGESAHYTLEGTVDRNAGVTALVSAVTKVVVDEDTAAWDVQVLANDTNDALQIDVTGEAAKTINWVFSGEFVKVTG